MSALLVQIDIAVAMVEDMDDKALGLWLGSQQTVLSPDVCRWIFPARKKNLMTVVHERGHAMRRRVCEAFRPTGNVLAGYVPSSAMNRFEADAV